MIVQLLNIPFCVSSMLTDVHWQASQYKERDFLYCPFFHVEPLALPTIFFQYRLNNFASFEAALWSALVSDYHNTTLKFIYFVGKVLHQKWKREGLWLDLNQCALLWRTKWVDYGIRRGDFMLRRSLLAELNLLLSSSPLIFVAFCWTPSRRSLS